MSQDTRKDPRAKVLTMTVRYKSATLEEFIEHHFHDISRGGMFIKTPSPFPPGTLLKFEVRIAENQRVMQGVGRVVWKRTATDANESRPPGMGVKFIKIDEASRKVIDQLVGSRLDAGAAYESGSVTQPAAPQARPLIGSPDSVSALTRAPNTALGRDSVSDGNSGDVRETRPEHRETRPMGAQFFPSGEPAELPPPEERTVMRQAAELLKDALRETGGSLEDGGGLGKAPLPTAGRPSQPEGLKPASVPPRPGRSSPPPPVSPALTNAVSAAEAARPAVASAPSSGKVEITKEELLTSEPILARAGSESSGSAKAASAAKPPSTAKGEAAAPAAAPMRPVAETPATAPNPPSGRGALIGLGLAAAAAIAFFALREAPEPPASPADKDAPQVIEQPTPPPRAATQPRVDPITAKEPTKPAPEAEPARVNDGAEVVKPSASAPAATVESPAPVASEVHRTAAPTGAAAASAPKPALTPQGEQPAKVPVPSKPSAAAPASPSAPVSPAPSAAEKPKPPAAPKVSPPAPSPEATPQKPAPQKPKPAPPPDPGDNPY